MPHAKSGVELSGRVLIQHTQRCETYPTQKRLSRDLAVLSMSLKERKTHAYAHMRNGMSETAVQRRWPEWPSDWTITCYRGMRAGEMTRVVTTRA